ncbi:MAG: archaellin/type IV pilin N-terminal domain-containing protein [Candidatus Pacearchaeota archaeon]
MKKRGISALIATVLLVLITIAAVGIIWGAILPLVQKGIMHGKACGLETRLIIDKTQGWTCFNRSEKSVIVMIERPLEDFDLVGINLQVSGEGKKKVYKINQTGDSKIFMWNGTHWINKIELPFKGEARTYKVIVNFTATEVGAAPIVKVGTTEETCSNFVTESLEECSGLGFTSRAEEYGPQIET